MIVLIAIIVMAVFLIVGFAVNKLDDKTIQKNNQLTGGYRKKHPELCKLLEEEYTMDLSCDSGLMLIYQLPVTYDSKMFGTLRIKLELDNRKDILSVELIKFTGEVLKGLRVHIWSEKNLTVEDYRSTIVTSFRHITAIVDWSPSKKRTPASKPKEVSKITESQKQLSDKNESVPKRTNNVSPYIREWSELKEVVKNQPNGRKLSTFIDDFFLTDNINYHKCLENLDILNPKSRYNRIANPDMGTKSIKDVFDIPPAFNQLFVAGYPDVFIWFQDELALNNPKFEFLSFTEENANQFVDEFGFKLHLLRAVCNMYKEEFGEFECI